MANKTTSKVVRTSSKILSAFALRRFVSRPFNARDLQTKFGEQKVLVHISSCRAVLKSLCNEGKLRVEGVGRNRVYVPCHKTVETTPVVA